MSKKKDSRIVTRTRYPGIFEPGIATRAAQESRKAARAARRVSTSIPATLPVSSRDEGGTRSAPASAAALRRLRGALSSDRESELYRLDGRQAARGSNR